MNNPISNHQLGQMRHQEYEMEASRTWAQESGLTTAPIALNTKVSAVMAMLVSVGVFLAQIV